MKGFHGAVLLVVKLVVLMDDCWDVSVAAL